ncbi:MAG: CoA activase, partial [Myxococcales bacterium]|nr:CoA activase [Myxococcales bacterium]
CHFCPNNCSRTFIDTRTPEGRTSRYISGFSCEKGTVESTDALKSLNAQRKQLKARFPNLVDYESKLAFRGFYTPEALPAAGAPVDDVDVDVTLTGRVRRTPVTRPLRRAPRVLADKREQIRIGMPRVLNMYSTAPFFRTYFEALGIPKTNVVFSEPTDEDMWVEGGKYGSIDPCFPSKVVQAHVHQLLFHAHSEKRPLQYIFFPILTHVPNFVADTMDNASCPIVAGTPEVIKAAFTKEKDFFAERGIEYVDPSMSFGEPVRLAARMFEAWGTRLGVTVDESDHAVREGLAALRAFEEDLQEKGRAILETVEEENRVAILVLGRPYHSDPGLNHGIPEEFQVLGYPIVSIRSIPRDRAFLDRFFGKELREGSLKSPLELNHIWPENYSANSAQKVWASNFAAHHPNLAVLDLSSFKCGHDAPTYGLIDTVLATAKTPAAALHDLDANKPGGSIKIRVKTYAHSLRLAEERLGEVAEKKRELALSLDEKRLELLELKRTQLGAASDRTLAADIEATRERIAAYRAAHAATPAPSPETPRGLVALGKRTKQGIEPVSLETAAPAAE